MAVKKSCEACRNLQEYAPEFVLNGVTENVENSLKNNTGFNPSSGRNDCDDLNDANDCLVGNMEDEVDAYEVCEWKEFMPDFIRNLWSVLKSIISAICGLWTRVERHDCELQAMVNGVTFNVGEESTDGSYVAAGKGVSFLGTGTEAGKSQITLQYIAGGLCRVTGTIIPYVQDFTDTGTCTNFDNGTAERRTASRKGNSYLNNTYTETHDNIKYHLNRRMTNGGELLYEIRILLSQYPMIKTLFSGHGFATGGGEYHVRFIPFTAGKYAYGNHGYCDTSTGLHSSDHDDGHLVPDGWLYLQCRLISIEYMIGSTTSDIHKYSPLGYIGIRLHGDELPCDHDDGGDDDDSEDD